jgi:hypothetical protein
LTYDGPQKRENKELNKKEDFKEEQKKEDRGMGKLGETRVEGQI